jgi:hypothetical protein
MALRSKLPGLAALAVLGLIAARLTRRRFRTGLFLFRLAVAFGESWSERRARRRVARVLSAAASRGAASDADPRAFPGRA